MWLCDNYYVWSIASMKYQYWFGTDVGSSGLGPDSIWRWHLTSIGNSIVEIRRSYDRLISTMGFPILVRSHLYIESGPWLKSSAIIILHPACLDKSLSLVWHSALNWHVIKSACHDSLGHTNRYHVGECSVHTVIKPAMTASCIE